MYDIMPHAAYHAMYLVSHERSEVNVFEDELDTRDPLVEARAPESKEARTTALLVPRQCKKTDKERERDEDKDEMRHGD
jgi:hypothetical protein